MRCLFVQKIEKELEVNHEKDVSSSRCTGGYHRSDSRGVQELQEIYKDKNKLIGGIAK